MTSSGFHLYVDCVCCVEFKTFHPPFIDKSCFNVFCLYLGNKFSGFFYLGKGYFRSIDPDSYLFGEEGDLGYLPKTPSLVSSCVCVCVCVCVWWGRGWRYSVTGTFPIDHLGIKCLVSNWSP